ncbi:MAG: beta-ketoacyl-ACP synthase II [Chitinophagales bacterium]|nr:beta-ketoacyl-ACP synthase II [Chitinophagales bacterium]
MEFKRTVITGLGAITPIGNTQSEYWESLKNGVSGANLITRFDASKFKTQFACEVKDYDPEKYFDRKMVKKLDNFAQFAMISSSEAIEDSGITSIDFDPDRIGVIFTSGIGGLNIFEQQMKEFFLGDGTPRFNPFFIPKMIIDIAPGHISMKYNFRGPNYSPVSACASSTHALIDAFTYIRLGKADAIVAGGGEAPITYGGIGGFNAMKALSERNDDYKTASRPFDKERDGFVMGEGSGAIVLEELEHAKKRGAKIYAEIVGGGATADAHHLTAPHPEGLGAKNVMLKALEDAQTSFEDVSYINVHGTSTPLGDIAELMAIQDVFGDKAYDLNISSTKSMTGHLLGAAGAIEAIACIKAIENGVIPPTINHSTPDDAIDPKLNLTLNNAQEKNVKVALCNTFGFGGHNASVVLKKFEG